MVKAAEVGGGGEILDTVLKLYKIMDLNCAFIPEEG